MFRLIMISFISTFLFCCSTPSEDKAVLPSVPSVPPPPTDVFTLSQYGITWYFDKEYPHGQFVTGDYWVVGPVKVIYIDPLSRSWSGRVIHGSMINPTPANGQKQGYDGAMYGSDTTNHHYEPLLNVGLPNEMLLSSDNPLIIPINSSLVSTKSHIDAGVRPQIQTAAVLTVLGSAPADNSFRPSYSGSNKTVQFKKADLNYSYFKSLTSVGTPPQLGTLEVGFERPWIDHVPQYLGRFIHPSENMPDYGRDISRAVQDGVISLNLNYTQTQKTKLLIGLTQFGIDTFGLVKEGMVWEDNGGHMMGRKLPVILAGLVLGNTEMSEVGKLRTVSGDLIFQEDRQTFVVKNSDVGRVMAKEAKDRYIRLTYVSDDVGMPEWGITHTNEVSWDSRNWAAYYRAINARPGVGTALCMYLIAPGGVGKTARDLWAWDPYLDYIDRSEEIQEKDFPDANWVQGSLFVRKMWQTYRKDYSPWPVTFPSWTKGPYKVEENLTKEQ